MKKLKLCDRLKVAAFDMDGTVRPPPIVGETPKAPPRELAQILRSLVGDGIHVASATGASLEGMRGIEKGMGFKFPTVAVSYAHHVIHREGHTPTEEWLAPKAERQAFFRTLPALNLVASNLGAVVDDRLGAFTMFLLPNSPELRLAGERVANLVACTNGRLRMIGPNPDGGITVIPASGGKHLFVQHLTGMGKHLVIGAGDTGSDEPLIRSAQFPIVTRSDERTPVNPKLAAIVQERGVGYVAKDHEPNVYGLMAGLEAARSAGVISF